MTLLPKLIEVDTRQVRRHLELLGDGPHHCGWFSGWIVVERIGSGFDVMWCSGETTHSPLAGPAISVEFQENGIGWVFKSAISMWPVRSDKERERLTKWMIRKVEQAAKKKEQPSRFRRLLMALRRNPRGCS